MSATYDQTIDEALQLIYSQERRFRRSLYGPAPDAISGIEELRGGPIGEKLFWLARIAEGEERASLAVVAEAARAVLDLLLWPVGADTYDVSQPFWDEPLGRMLTRAKWRCADPTDLMSIGAAAEYLGVTRPTIYRWMSTGTIESVRDDVSDRFFLLRSEMERMRGDAARMAMEQEIMPRGEPAMALAELADDD
jgi:hypothetical protein